jgi:hypothetical protein
MKMNHCIVQGPFGFLIDEIFDSVNTKERFGDFGTQVVYVVFLMILLYFSALQTNKNLKSYRM